MRAMTGIKVGYARVLTAGQDLAAQRDGLISLGVTPDRVYVDHGLTAPTATGQACGARWPPAALKT